MKKKLQAAVVTAAVVAGMAIAATPAQALNTCKGGGVLIGHIVGDPNIEFNLAVAATADRRPAPLPAARVRPR